VRKSATADLRWLARKTGSHLRVTEESMSVPHYSISPGHALVRLTGRFHRIARRLAANLKAPSRPRPGRAAGYDFRTIQILGKDPPAVPGYG
jgi:hypothetical protein